MSRPLKLKVTGAVCCRLPTPRSRVIGLFAGAHRRRFPPFRLRSYADPAYYLPEMLLAGLQGTGICVALRSAMEARLCAHDNSMCESDGVSAMSAIRELNFAPKGEARLPLPDRCSLDVSCFEEPEVQDALAIAIEEILYVVAFSGIELQALDGVTVASDCRAAACALQNLPQGQVPLEMSPQPEVMVRQSAKRERIPDVLELAELQLLLTKLETRERTLVLLAAATGLRVSELLGIRWADVDFDTLELSVTRSIWHQKIGECKTEASAKPVPLDGYMAEDLLQWRKKSPYPMQEDWVFASPTMKGEQPYWPDNLMKRYIKPVARANGIYKNIGWHTFRHTFGTLLKANGEDVKTVQELLRHANSRITLDVYTQAVGSNKRAAQSKVVRMMISGVGQNEVEMDPQKARIGA